MDPTTLAVIVAAMLAKVSENAAGELGESSAKLWASLREKLLAKDSALNPSELPLKDSVEALQAKIEETPGLAQEIGVEAQELMDQIGKENPQLAKEIKDKFQELTNRLSDLEEQINNISTNITKGDYIGIDDDLFSGRRSVIYNIHHQTFYNNDQKNIYGSTSPDNIKTISIDSDPLTDTKDESKVHHLQTESIRNVLAFRDDINDIVGQIQRARGSITKLIRVESDLVKLEELRKPSSIFNRNKTSEMVITGTKFFSILFFLIISLPASLFNKSVISTLISAFEKLLIKGEKVERIQEQEKLDPDLISLSKIRHSLRKIIEAPGNQKELQSLIQELGVLIDKINVRVAIRDGLFISLLYPVSSSKELVANAVSKIGHKEFSEEAEMHLSAISQLVEKLNKLIEKIDIEKLPKKEDERPSLPDHEDPTRVIKAIIDFSDENEIEGYVSLIKKMSGKSRNIKNDSSESVTVGGKTSAGVEENFYILCDEAQAIVGMMTAIEERRLIVENLVRLDRKRQSVTVGFVTAYIITIMGLAIFAYFQYGNQFKFNTSSPLSETNLAFVSIPWPVVLWSLIGSFAAMLYRFNRQPIYDFGHAIKWMLTRPVQGVVLGSAFYLVLVSGQFLLTRETSVSNGASKIANEVVLILSFLVGFSDRFADSVFNALVDRYSKDSRNDKSETTSETQEDLQKK